MKVSHLNMAVCWFETLFMSIGTCGCRKPVISAKIVIAPGVRESLAWPWNILLKVESLK